MTEQQPPTRVYLVMLAHAGECELVREVCATREYAERVADRLRAHFGPQGSSVRVWPRDVARDAIVLSMPVEV